MLKRLAMLMLVAVLPLAACANQEAKKEPHKVIFHVDDNDAAKMNLTMNNAANVTQYYRDLGEDVTIEIVAYGPGLMMLVDGDKNPVHKRAASFTDNFPNIGFRACGNTIAAMTKKAGGQAPKILASASVVPSGVIQLMSRQEEGWTYVRP